MMVTFISQCEKKALNRSRRVLDAFADRIGNNTWQTVITQEGLLAIKKLLRKTASKNTAVSCHWIRSRSRTELVWVVGSRDKFSCDGVVPVNTTLKEVPMDITINRPIEGVSYANTKLQRLDQHLFAVGYVAQALYQNFYPDKIQQSKAVFVAGCLHDLGKVEPGFQGWVTKNKNRDYVAEDGQHIDDSGKFNFESHPRHNEISVLLYHLLDDKSLKTNSPQNKLAIRHAIYWHHAKPFRPKAGKDAFGSYGYVFKKLDSNEGGNAWNSVVMKSIDLLKRVCDIEHKYNEGESSYLSKCFLDEADQGEIIGLENHSLPNYKDYDSVDDDLEKYKNAAVVNANNNEIRACLITADRWVSSLTADELNSVIQGKTLDSFVEEQLENQLIPESLLTAHIDECLKLFPDTERTRKQLGVAQKLAEDIQYVKVLAGAAGCGKTKIALEWAKLRDAQQLIWVCPRVQICQGLFAELSSSDNPYLPDAKVELHTGEFKCINSYQNITAENEYFTGDVVITTIDQILNSVISHSQADRLLSYLSAHVVFDEYHEYITMPAFNLLFAELVNSRKELTAGANVLLVSATPHYLYLETILGLDSQYDVVEMPSFNRSRYQFIFESYDETLQDTNNPLYRTQDATTFVISNTAITAQKSFIQNQLKENALLLHSKFKKSDKQKLFELVFETFKCNGTGQYDLLRSGPIVQASLNISCDYMVSEITNAENSLQRLGRLDRFGLNQTDINQYRIAVPNTLHEGKGIGALAKFLSNSNSLGSAKAWYEFLSEATIGGEKVLTLPEIYGIYRLFYSDPSALNLIKQDLIAAMKKSAALITDKVAEPKVIVKPKKGKKQRTKISKRSLRGDSRFVQLAVCDVTAYPFMSFLEDYAYEIPIRETDEIDNLTASTDQIQGYGNSSGNLLAHMMKKHHNIKGEKKAYKDFILLNEAIDPESPIYLSYTPNDLLAVGGEQARHSEAIYYGVCEKQPIGAISIKQLNNQKD